MKGPNPNDSQIDIPPCVKGLFGRQRDHKKKGRIPKARVWSGGEKDLNLDYPSERDRRNRTKRSLFQPSPSSWWTSASSSPRNRGAAHRGGRERK
ncbi:hypothetical protein COCNU_contig69234932G000010 [Cocos nucifera]|nr:hypothetical protein [Cocos nucifera]